MVVTAVAHLHQPDNMKTIIAKRKEEVFEIIVSDEDFDIVSKYHWGINSNGYALRWFNVFPRQQYLHHLIIGKPKSGFVVDHINRNRLDNRRENLRIVTHNDNLQNRGADKRSVSGIKGISKCSKTGKWFAEFMANGKRYRLGRFKTIEEASKELETAKQTAGIK